MRTRWPAFLLLSALALGACDSSTPLEQEEPATATFRAELSGPITGTLEGTAEAGAAGHMHAGDDFEAFITFDDLFRDLPDAPFRTGLALMLVSGERDRREAISISYLGPELPTPGTYAVGPTEPLGRAGRFGAGFSRRTEAGYESYSPAYSFSVGEGGAMPGPAAGTVTVDALTDERFAGRFDVRLAMRFTVSHEALAAFVEQAEAGAPPELPPFDLEVLEEPLVITGTFDARRLPDVER